MTLLFNFITRFTLIFYFTIFLVCPQCKADQSCMDDGTCCNENCAGGCFGTANTHCIACRGVLLLHNNTTRCLTTCPVNTYKVQIFLSLLIIW